MRAATSHPNPMASLPLGFDAPAELGRLQKVLEELQRHEVAHTPALMEAVRPAIVALGGILRSVLPGREESRSGLSPWQRRKVARLIEESLHEPIPVAEMANVARLSRSAFTRAFSASFGQSPHAYVVGRRIARAQELMISTNEPLAQIAVACGLADQAHLSRVFRQRIGTTPRSWRRTALSRDIAA